VARVSGTFDAGLAVAASRLVEGSLGLVRGETLLFVYDAGHAAMADPIADAAKMSGAVVVAFRLEDLGGRPCTRAPAAVTEAMESAQASLLLVDFHRGELAMRTEIVELASRFGLRHGHMVGVSRASMVAGFSVDPRRVGEQMRSLLVRLRPDARLHVRSRAGTDLVIGLAPQCQWVDYGCVVQSGKRVNLPGGELVTCPVSVDGTYVADGTLGDADGVLARNLGKTPLALHVAGSRVQSVECPSEPALARLVQDRLRQYANLDRVGLVGFGVNIGVTAPVGDVFTDQKVPAVHLSLGETFPEKTGAVWNAKNWVAITSRENDVDVDKLAVLRSGRYLV
jgi:leucyl aminopeptidase (aminopeptidase T)